MKKVIIIGSGNIGSRHLQGLRSVIEPVSIKVVDPSKDAQVKAKALFKEVKITSLFNGELCFTSEMPERQIFDIAIVATNSAIRRQVTERLLKHNTVRFLILEKFLFQTFRDYDEVEKLLQKKGTTAYVNCPRRMNSFYRRLREKISKTREPIEFYFSGTNWGLACNGIHRIDLFAFLVNENDINLNIEGIEKKILKSKRDGYIEFTGRIEGTTSNGSKLIMTSFLNGNAPNLQIINTPSTRYFISEKQRYMFVSTAENDWNWERREFTMAFQSQLTNKVTEQLLKHGHCQLTPYSESAIYHKLYLKALLNHMNSILEEKAQLCPIT